MSQQEIIQFIIENYDYEIENRKLKINNKEYTLHITKQNFEFHEERKEEDVNYVNHIIIKEVINVEVIRSFNFKEINTLEMLKVCVETALKNIQTY